jgi:hypothetical protein
LGEAGTSYQALLDDVRRQAARRLLADTDLDSGEVAFLLGFEELNSFTRAFHTWGGNDAKPLARIHRPRIVASRATVYLTARGQRFQRPGHVVQARLGGQDHGQDGDIL